MSKPCRTIMLILLCGIFSKILSQHFQNKNFHFFIRKHRYQKL